MQIQNQIPIRACSGVMKGFQTVFPRSGETDSNDPVSKRGGLFVPFQGQDVTIHDFTHVLIGPEGQQMLNGSIVRVRVDNVGPGCFLVRFLV